jgi:hypothetical protein
LQNAVNEDGLDNFIFFVLSYCDDVLELTICEQYFIDLLNPDYNLITLVERNILSQESREKISNSLKKLYREGFVQVQHTTVKVYTTSGEYVNTFYTIEDCARKLNINSSGIRAVLRGEYAQIKGYIFYYENENNIRTIMVDKKGKAVRTKETSIVFCKPYNITNTLTNETLFFKSVTDSCNYLKLSSTTFNKYMRLGAYKHYKIAPVKLDKLLENQEIDNQQPTTNLNG